jgi:NitT/TauT family transport system substrate-binding protein
MRIFRSPGYRWILGVVIFITLLGVLRYRPWRYAFGTDDDARALLTVGFLPVTCHLTCPVTDYSTRTSKTTRFRSQLFMDFPTVAETMKAGRLEATFMIAPLAMKLREQNLPVKILYLGHRDGSTLVVRKDLPAKSLRDLRGRSIGIPSKYSNQYLVLRKLMDDQGVQPDEIRFVEMQPPDMPGALASKALDAYFVGEPYPARAELDGTGRVLYYAKDIWPHFISCVLVAHEKLIQERPEVVRDLVRGIAQSGAWVDDHRVEAARIAAPYFWQEEKLLRFVLTQPPDRVSYRMLTPTDVELTKIRDMALKAGILARSVEMHDLVDRSFIPADDVSVRPSPLVDQDRQPQP